MASTLADLHAPEAAKRVAASQVIERAARMESSRARQKALGRRTVTAALIGVFDDAEAEVVRNAVVAIAEIGRRYLKDDRAYPAVVRLLGNSDAITRLWAVEAAVVLRGWASLGDVSPLARDRSAKVRAGVIRLVAGLALQSDVPAAVRTSLQAMIAVAADDRDRQVRECATTLVRALAVPVGTA